MYKFATHKDTTFFYTHKFYNISILISKENILASAKKTILSESESIAKLVDFLDENFIHAVETIYNSKGRLVVTGIGKSAIIAQKIVATLNSTGTPSLFLHASEAIHGDLGMIQKDDAIICISKSGNSPEIKVLVPLLKRFGNKLIAITGNKTSFLGKEAHYTLNTYVDAEACPINLAPTNSTTAQLVIGDAIAVCLMEMREFKAEDFAKFHPGGNLGKRLTLTAGQIASVHPKPAVHRLTSLKEVIITISKNRLGATAVVDEKNNVEGIITDGDIRRMLEQFSTIQQLTASDIYHTAPITISPMALAVEALSLMEQKDISQLIVADGSQYVGMIHIHDLMKEGIL